MTIHPFFYSLLPAEYRFQCAHVLESNDSIPKLLSIEKNQSIRNILISKLSSQELLRDLVLDDTIFFLNREDIVDHIIDYEILNQLGDTETLHPSIKRRVILRIGTARSQNHLVSDDQVTDRCHGSDLEQIPDLTILQSEAEIVAALLETASTEKNTRTMLLGLLSKNRNFHKYWLVYGNHLIKNHPEYYDQDILNIAIDSTYPRSMRMEAIALLEENEELIGIRDTEAKRTTPDPMVLHSLDSSYTINEVSPDPKHKSEQAWIALKVLTADDIWDQREALMRLKDKYLLKRIILNHNHQWFRNKATILVHAE